LNPNRPHELAERGPLDIHGSRQRRLRKTFVLKDIDEHPHCGRASPSARTRRSKPFRINRVTSEIKKPTFSIRAAANVDVSRLAPQIRPVRRSGSFWIVLEVCSSRRQWFRYPWRHASDMLSREAVSARHRASIWTRARLRRN
jgi:hypothetical protein